MTSSSMPSTHYLKKQKTFPKRKFMCVYSEEQPLKNQGIAHTCGLEQCICQHEEHSWNDSKAQINGSLCHITAIFGMSIAGMVINTIIAKK